MEDAGKVSNTFSASLKQQEIVQYLLIMTGSPLNTVVTKVTIKGEDLKFISLRLHQKFNAHHTFTIIVNYLSPKNAFQQTPQKFIQYIGETANITFSHKQTGETNEFAGIVTQVEMVGSAGECGGIAIHGCSPTILYENNQTMNSWTDQTLQNIVNKAVEGMSPSLKNNPQHTTAIPYLAQYKETVFNFMNRLSMQYGEWFYYDGKDIFFGNPNKTETTKIIYDMDLEEVRLIANLIPGKYKGYSYEYDKNDTPINAEPSVPSMDSYQKQAHDMSEKAYSIPAIQVSNPYTATSGELKKQMDIMKKTSASNLLNIRGKGNTCRIKIGGIVEVSFPEPMNLSPLGSFRITEMEHTVKRDGHYSNEFWGIPSSSEYIPINENIPLPMATPEMATVTSNADEQNQGRVKVRLDWQNDEQTTNWIRVQSSNAGCSEKVGTNRGYMFIPEENDRVMVNYEQGDPSRPYVAGSIYTAKTGKGGDKNNKIKSIVTRSGCRILFDDEKGSITIADQTGKQMLLLDGKDTITVTATKTIVLTNEKSTIHMEEDRIGITAKEICIDASDTLYLQSKDQQITVTKSGEGIHCKGKTISTESETTKMDTQNGEITASTELSLSGNSKVTVEGGLVNINS